MGVFDATKATNRIWSLVQAMRVTTKEIRQTLQSCYLTTSDRKGASDIIGMTSTGRFIAVEVKGKGDQLDKDKDKPFQQENFLKEVGQKGGLAFIVAEEPSKIRLRGNGFGKIHYHLHRVGVFAPAYSENQTTVSMNLFLLAVSLLFAWTMKDDINLMKWKTPK